MDGTVVLSGDFGYVVLVMIFSVFMLMWMGFKVGTARKKYEVPVSHKDNKMFYFLL